jgi:uncharacterized protein (DUF305 family)
MNRTVRRVLMLGLISLTASIVAACGDSNDSGMPTMPGTSGNASGSSMMGHSTADVEFAQMMIAHHQQAVEMSTVAESRAADAEVKTLAVKIRSAQEPEIITMAGWLTSWSRPTAQPGGHDMPGMGGMPGMMSGDELKQLHAATGADFDRMFARMMISHHEGAIQMANDVLSKSADPQVKAFAQQVVTAQTTEVDQLRKILDRL